MTDRLRQLAILKQIGVDVWVERQPRVAAQPADTQPAEIIEAQTHQQNVQQIPQAAPVLDEAQMDNAAFSVSQPQTEPTSQTNLSPQQRFVSFDALRQQVSQCQACELAKERTQTVFGVGNEQADWLFIGEAPGQQEDMKGEPFVGRAGQLLDAMLKALSLSRQQVYIANTVKCHPPNNRDPQPDEIAQCHDYLKAQIDFIAPKVIVALGHVSAQTLTGQDAPMSRLRGQVHYYADTNIPLIVTYHPAYLLRKGQDKALAWQDLCLANSMISQ